MVRPASPGGASQPLLSPADGLAVPELNSTATLLFPASVVSSRPGIQPPGPSAPGCVLRSAGAGPWLRPRAPGILPTMAWVRSLLSFLNPRTALGDGSRVQLAVATPDPTCPRPATPFPPREVSFPACEPPFHSPPGCGHSLSCKCFLNAWLGKSLVHLGSKPRNSLYRMGFRVHWGRQTTEKLLKNMQSKPKWLERESRDATTTSGARQVCVRLGQRDEWH